MAAKHNVNNIPDQNGHDRGIIIISSEYYVLDTRETEYSRPIYRYTIISYYIIDQCLRATHNIILGVLQRKMYSRSTTAKYRYNIFYNVYLFNSYIICGRALINIKFIID